MSQEFVKISSGFVISWDLDKIEEQFVTVVIPEGVQIHSDPLKRPHWQTYAKSKISFARNFSNNFPKECNEIAEKLRAAQLMSIENTHQLIDKFMLHAISPDNVGLIKVFPGESVGAHCDVTRSVSINIGLKNSNAGTTYVSDGTNIKEFWQQNLSSYTMQDGDVYLLQVKNSHAVKSNVSTNSGLTRYIITYTMMDNL
jgi:hypothetical protein